jgi:hypothetical protein
MKTHKNAQIWKCIQVKQEKGQESTDSGGETHQDEA